MVFILLICYYLIIFAISCGITIFLYKHKSTVCRLDIPNHRSAHTSPTPRGGGIAVVGSFFIGISLLLWKQQLSLDLFISIIIATIIVAITGLIDDYFNCSAIKRLIWHCVAASILSYQLYSYTLILNIFSIIYLVWLLNIFNFMDGIDSLTAMETITICINSMILYNITGINTHQLYLLPLTLSASVCGFVIFNLPPARIFMGDIGSGFLGILIGLFSLLAAKYSINLFFGWITLTAVFITDTSITLLRRWLNKEDIFTSHNQHAYQHAARYYKKHSKVTINIILINLLWLLPLAIIEQLPQFNHYKFNYLLYTTIAYLPIIAITLRFHAGQKIKNHYE